MFMPSWCSFKNPFSIPLLFSDEKFGKDSVYECDGDGPYSKCRDVVKIRTHEFSSQGRNIYFGLKKGTIIKLSLTDIKTGLSPLMHLESYKDYIAAGNSEKINIFDTMTDRLCYTYVVDPLDPIKKIGFIEDFTENKIYFIALVNSRRGLQMFFTRLFACGASQPNVIYYEMRGNNDLDSFTFSVHQQFYNLTTQIKSENSTSRALILLSTKNQAQILDFNSNTNFAIVTFSSLVSTSVFYLAPPSVEIINSVIIDEKERRMNYTASNCTNIFGYPAQNFYLVLLLSSNGRHWMEIRQMPEFYQYEEPSVRQVLNPGNRPNNFNCVNQYLENGVCKDPVIYQQTLDEKPSLILHRYSNEIKYSTNTTSTSRCEGLRTIDYSRYLQCIQIESSIRCPLDYYQNTTSELLSQVYERSLHSLLFISLGDSNRVLIFGVQPILCSNNEVLIAKMNDISFAGNIIDMEVSQNGQYLLSTITRDKWELDSIIRFQNICRTLEKDPDNMFLYPYADSCKSFPNVSLDINQFGQFASVCPPGSLCPSLNENIMTTVKEKRYTFRPNMERICNPGFFCQNGVQVDCPQGFTCPFFGMTKPEKCLKDNSLSTTCSSGKLTKPKQCPQGAICTVPYFPPFPASPGHFSDLENGKRRNIPCRPGEYCPLGRYTENDRKDLLCPEKTVCVTPFVMEPRICGCGLGNCSYCPPGSFQENLCPQGFKCNPSKTPQIQNCTRREYCGNGTVIPELCPPGFYCPTPAEKIICPKGFFCKIGQVRPTACPIPFFCEEGTNTDPINFLGLLIDVLIIIIVVVIYVLGNLGIHYYRKYREKRRSMVERGLLKSESQIKQRLSDIKGDTQCCIDIRFENLGLVLKGTGQTVLNDVNGMLKSGRVTAVMGPSGCGKSTFLTTISGRAFYGNRTGDIYLNGVKDDLTNYKNLVGFVPQEDVMIRTMTVEDILFFSAYSRLDWRTPRELVTRIVDNVIKTLGLNEIRHQVIGDEITRGISGGQRKRVNIGMELVAKPIVLFLDEPTSGLDSSSSKEVCQALSNIARKGITVATVIHQPRYEIFTMIDDVLLLGKGGKVVYHGESKNALKYFESIGFKCPEHVNPPDFFMDIISGDVPRENDPDFKKEDLFELWKLKKPTEQPQFNYEKTKTPKDESKSRKKFILCQSWLCFFRALKQQFHNLSGFFLDNLLFFISGLFLGITFYRKSYIGSLPEEVIQQCLESLRPLCSLPQNDVIILTASATPLAMALTSTIAALKVFGDEKAVFRRENEAGMSSLAYFTSKNLAQTFSLITAPLVYLSIFYSLFVPRASFIEYYFALLVIVYTGYGFGYFISIVFGSFAQLVGIVISMTFYNFSGTNPTLPQIAEMPFPLKIMPYLSYLRYAQETLYLIEIKNYANIYDIQKSLDLFGYKFSNLIPNIFIVLAFGVGIRIVGYICLILSLPDSYFFRLINWIKAIPTKVKNLKIWKREKKEIEKSLVENDFLQQSVENREIEIQNMKENTIQIKEEIKEEEIRNEYYSKLNQIQE